MSPPPEMAAPADVAAPSAEAMTTASGVAMKVLTRGSGTEHPAGDDCVTVIFTVWKRDGSLFASSGPHGESAVQCLTAAIPGIAEALNFMVVGERRRIWLPSKLSVAPHAHHGMKKMPDDATPKPDLTADVELIRIFTGPPPPANLKSPPATAFRTSSGVSIELLKRGTGTKHPTMKSWATLNYSCWTADGKLVESTIRTGHPAAVLLGTALTGWREALPHLVAGDTARVWIPAALAYGEHPIDKLAPAGNLVYEIELLDFN